MHTFVDSVPASSDKDKLKYRNTKPLWYIKLTVAPPKAHYRRVLRTRLGYHGEFLRREQDRGITVDRRDHKAVISRRYSWTNIK